MARLIRLLILVAATCGGGGVAAAQNGEAGAAPPCTAGNSQRVTIGELWSGERRLRRRCVAIESYRIGDVIFDNQRALYWYMARTSEAAPGIVGIPYPVQLESAPGLMRGIYYGRAESCRVARRNYARTARNLRRRPPSDEIILIHLYGFCAGSAGPAVRVERAEERPSSDLRRLTGEALGTSLGELVPIDGRYRYRAILPWLVDTATNGCAGDFEVQAAPPGGPPVGRGAPVWQPQLGEAQREQLTRWCGSPTRQRALFEVAGSSRQVAEAGTRLDIVMCFCLTGDCTGRWPVALIDAGWTGDRPYLCQRVKLRPRMSTHPVDGGKAEYSEYSYEFANEFLVGGTWQEWGFPEP